MRIDAGSTLRGAGQCGRQCTGQAVRFDGELISVDCKLHGVWVKGHDVDVVLEIILVGFAANQPERVIDD